MYLKVPNEFKNVNLKSAKCENLQLHNSFCVGSPSTNVQLYQIWNL